MTTDAEKKEQPRKKKITFKCKFCNKSKSIDVMVTLPGYFPPIVACQDCEKKMR